MLLKKPDKNREKEPINGRAVMNGWLFLVICLVGEMIYKYARDDNSCVWELILIMASCAVVGISGSLMSKKTVPKGRNGQPMPCGNSKIERAARRKKYIYDSAVIAVILAIVVGLFVGIGAEKYGLSVENLLFGGAVTKWAAAGICAVVVLIAGFFISYGFVSSSGEFRVKTYGNTPEDREKKNVHTKSGE